MAAITLGRTLGASVALVAVLNTMSALSLPVMSRRPATITVVAWLILLSVHAALYWWGVPIRARVRLPGYVAAQAVTLFGLIVSGAPVPVALGLLMTFTAEVVLLAGARWGSIPITAGAIALYVTAAVVSSNLYRAATAGLALAVTGAMAHGLAALFRRPAASLSDSALSHPLLPRRQQRRRLRAEHMHWCFPSQRRRRHTFPGVRSKCWRSSFAGRRTPTSPRRSASVSGR